MFPCPRARWGRGRAEETSGRRSRSRPARRRAKNAPPAHPRVLDHAPCKAGRFAVPALPLAATRCLRVPIRPFRTPLGGLPRNECVEVHIGRAETRPLWRGLGFDPEAFGQTKALARMAGNLVPCRTIVPAAAADPRSGRDPGPAVRSQVGVRSRRFALHASLASVCRGCRFGVKKQAGRGPESEPARPRDKGPRQRAARRHVPCRRRGSGLTLT